MDPFIGEIRILPYTFAPQDWATCDGTLLPVGQYQALYALIGNLYGGTQNQSFATPNLQSSVPMGTATGSVTELGQNKATGTNTVTLTVNQMPGHTHSMGGELAGGVANVANTPSPTVLPNLVGVVNGTTFTSQNAFATGSPNTNLHPASIDLTGGNGAHENRQPFLAVRFCICTDGIFPDFP